MLHILKCFKYNYIQNKTFYKNINVILWIIYVQIVRCAYKDEWRSIIFRDSSTSSSHIFVEQKSITEHWRQIIFDFGHKIFYVLTKMFTSKYIDRYFRNVTIKPYKELFSILCYVNTRSLNDIIVSVSLIMRIIVLNEFRLHRLSCVSSMSRSRWGCRWFHLDLFQCQSHVHVEFLFV